MSAFKQFFFEASPKEGDVRAVHTPSGVMHQKWSNDVWMVHREDGPAVEFKNGDKQWWIDNQIHRVGGPALEYANGDKEWDQFDELHREDGPAIEYSNGRKQWYLYGEELSEAEHLRQLVKMGLYEPTSSDWGRMI